MNLIVVESPTKARTLSRFLGKDFGVEATVGHIKDLPKSKLGIDIENEFKPSYDLVVDKEKNIEKIKKQSKKAKGVFLATDPDREGEAIAAHVKEEVGNAKTKRIVFHEITKRAVEHAIKNPRDIDKNLVEAQIARRVLDRLVGYKLSPLLWKKVRRGLSAGRVQTVTVRLIVEREREIESFKQQEYWEIFCNVKSQKSIHSASLSTLSSRPKGSGLSSTLSAQTEGMLSKAEASKVKSDEFIVKLVKIDDKKTEIKDGKTAKTIVLDLEKASYKVFDVKKKEVRKNPYPPFTTSTMTQTSARFFGWSARRTMTVAQRLYEKGLITYHRTDSTHIAKVAVAKVREFIKKEYGGEYLPDAPRFYKTKSKVAQEAHEAIRPTKVSKLKVEDTKIKEAGKLYGLIWKRFVACQVADSVYDGTTIEVLANRYLLRASGQIMKFDGWRRVIPPAKDDEPRFPQVEKGEALDLIKVNPGQKFTQPPARYNDASLIKTLEKLGIGRPSTYAPIITTIQTRNYVEKIEGKFHPTPVGFTVNDFLVKHFPKIFDYKFTAEMEDDLDNVANGKRKWATMMKDFYSPFEVKLEKVTEKAKRVKIATEKLGKKCPKCGGKGLRPRGPQARRGELVIRIGRFGKFISCSRFPDCDYTEKYLEKIGMKCLDCGKGDVIIKTTKKKRRFYGCSRYPDCKWASWHKPKVSKGNYATRS